MDSGPYRIGVDSRATPAEQRSNDAFFGDAFRVSYNQAAPTHLIRGASLCRGTFARVRGATDMEDAVHFSARTSGSASADTLGAGEEPPQPAGFHSDAAQGACALEFVDATGHLSAKELSGLRSQVAAAAAHLGAAGEVRVRLVGDEEMAANHVRHMGVQGTTDVITFDLAEGRAASGEAMDVDLLICVDEAERQAARRGIDRQRELLLYALHGMLHCLGHDDTTERAAAAMHEKEDQTLSAMGMGPIYALAERTPEN